MRPIILIGGGGHCKSVIEAAESSGRKIKGILDLPDAVGAECLGYRIIGDDSDIPFYVEECDFVITLGFIKNPFPRIRLHELVLHSGGHLATVIASTAQISKHSKIGEGSVILHHATINAGANIGKSCIINTASNVEHDVVIGNYTHVSTGAMINGDCIIGDNTFIGSNSVIGNCVNVTDNCIIGAGSVVVSDVEKAGIYFGNPLRLRVDEKK